MAKMVTEKVKISPYLHREIESLVEDGDFASISDAVNVALSSFLERKYDISEEEGEEKSATMITGTLSIALLYTLLEKKVITSEDINETLTKIKNRDLDPSSMLEIFKGMLTDDDIYEMIDEAKELEDEKNYEEAEKIYSVIIGTHPDDFEAYFHLGCLYKKTDREEEGKNLLKQALEIAEENEEDEDIIKMITRKLEKE